MKGRQIAENVKNVKKSITYHFVKNVGQFSNPEWCSLAGEVAEGGIIART